MRPLRPALAFMFILTMLLAAGITWLVLISWGDPVADAYYWRPAALMNTMVWLTFAMVGQLIWLRKPDNSVGWVLSAIGMLMLVTSFIEEYSVRGLLLDPGSLPTADGLAISGQFLWTIPIGLLPILMLLYPTGRLLSRRWRLACLPTILGVVAGAISTVLIWPYRDRAGEILLADEAPAELPVIVFLMGGTLVIWFLGLAAGVLALIRRWRVGDPVMRRQIKLLLLSSTALTVALVVINVVGSTDSLASELVVNIALAALPISIAIAVLRYRLYEIDRIVSRTVTYVLVLVLLGLVVLGLVTVFALFLPSDDPLVVAVSTLAAAGLFNPLRRRVQGIVDRRFNRSRYDAQRVIDDFTGSLRERVDPESVVDGWVGVVSETMQPTTVGVWVRNR